MLKLFSSAIILSALLPALVQAAEINTDSTIKAVTIYPSSAKVTRISTITLTAGDNDIVIDNLPINLNESSLRVSGEAEGSVSLGSVELIRNIQRDVVQGKERDLRKKIEDLNEGRKEVEDALNRNRSQLQYINKMVLGSNVPELPQNQEKNGTYNNLPLEQWTQAWQTLDSATAAAQEKIRLAEKSLRNTDKEIRKLNRELNQVAVNQSETRSAKLHVESQSSTELTLKLTYQINGAHWVPVYDADLDTQTGDIALKTLAQISQRTGEEWKGVDVTLSTLRPSAGTQLPPLNTWSIDFMPEFLTNSFNQSDKIQMESDAGLAEVFGQATEMVDLKKEAAVAARKPRKRMVPVQSQVISTDFSAEYKVPGIISLDSGSNKRRFALTSKSYKSDIHLASVPRFDPRAMILAKTKYNAETPLLAGSLALYRNGSFVGNTRITQKQLGEEIKLSFGEDDKVKVKFLPDPDKKRKDGLLFGKKKVVERHYKVSVTNNHNKPYSISLYDSIPVALNEGIKVIKTGDAPSTNKVDDKKGVISWERTLTPNKEMKIKYGYTVSYPEDKTVPGL